jgi:hypothetical protein
MTKCIRIIAMLSSFISVLNTNGQTQNICFNDSAVYSIYSLSIENDGMIVNHKVVLKLECHIPDQLSDCLSKREEFDALYSNECYDWILNLYIREKFQLESAIYEILTEDVWRHSFKNDDKDVYLELLFE